MFVGRERELEILKALWRKPSASLVTCRGRRRIGKSTLITEFARRNHVRFVRIEGAHPLPGVTNEIQLDNFARQLSEQTSMPYEPLTNWFDAFKRLDGCLKQREKTVVLLDEISWMGKYDSMFTGNLKIAWDNWFSKKPKLIMVLCGSVSSWIDKNILKSKGFVGRTSMNMFVRELSMEEASTFWKGSGAKLATRDIVDVLSVTGGVPKYLESIDPSTSATENIGRLCFCPGGLLVDEFEEIFDDALDANLALKKRILESMADGSRSPSEIGELLGIESNGHLSSFLWQLEEAGFIEKESGLNPVNGKVSNLVRYRIIDNYTRFYLKYIAPKRQLIRRGAYRFLSLDHLPGWKTILGLQFEALVQNNLSSLLDRLHLDGTLLTSAAPYRQSETTRSSGCQVDLLIQSEGAIRVVEIKRREYIGESVIDEVREKVRRLKIKRGVSVFPILVYAGEISKRVEAAGYFNRIISAEDLLGFPK